ncbi:hypothetical protein SAMN05444401_3381 [Clostridium amylolyticum]|uniref:Uncharacterized protein n=1 Tax=Clostridium amylolyticum TaxID=1121298 RepID=A0A1M6KJ18_9CLOT|nr:prepilin-type N-terminal cleavage/methylation domain-containing protein [Clostridium amylolyticum]SHJ58933.1 hypothetical protein SAMN05444401_3381 [Clostridium amylolyticum]
MTKNKGNTLIEILLSMSILMIIGSLITTMVVFAIKDMHSLKTMHRRLEIVDTVSKELTMNANSSDVNNLNNTIIKLNSKTINLERLLSSDIVGFLIDNSQVDEEYDIQLEFFKKEVNEIYVSIIDNHKEIFKIQLFKE